MIKVFATGRLTKDPICGKTNGGVEYAAFSIATDRKVGGEKKTDFFDVICWRKTAEFVGKFFKKGKPITLVGELQQNSYKDRDGNPKTKVEIVASEVEFQNGDSKANGSAQPDADQPQADPTQTEQPVNAAAPNGGGGGDDFDPWAGIG
jgi:single-strand DNA-binding protein